MASIAILIPTRNRPDLAIAAVRSLIDQDIALDIYVSDNSADPGPLAAFFARETRATLLRPPRELAMPAHWDWALGEVLERSAVTHLSVHYDRKISKPGSWARLARVAARRPDELVSFPVDHISHWPPPRRLWQAPWTGRLFEIRSAAVAAAIAGGRFASVAQALPLLSNCLVPREVLERIAARFGTVCLSTGPDTAFMARYFALFDSFLHHDEAAGISYAAHRSNGLGYLRGKGGDFADFVQAFGEGGGGGGDGGWLAAAPLPGVNLGQNLLYHEYELVRRATGDRLPPLERAAILEDLGSSLSAVADPGARRGMAQLLRREGWSGAEPGRHVRPHWRVRRREIECRLRMKWRGERPPHICGFSFLSDRNALRAAMLYPRRPDAEATHLAPLEPAEIAP